MNNMRDSKNKRPHKINVTFALILFVYTTLLAIFVGGDARKMCFFSVGMAWVSDYFVRKDQKNNSRIDYSISTMLFICAQIIMIICYGKLLITPNYPANESGAYLMFRLFKFVGCMLLVYFIFEEKYQDSENDLIFLHGVVSISLSIALLFITIRHAKFENTMPTILSCIGSVFVLISNFRYNYIRLVSKVNSKNDIELVTFLYYLGLILLTTFAV